jgi:hypothetical protein
MTKNNIADSIANIAFAIVDQQGAAAMAHDSDGIKVLVSLLAESLVKFAGLSKSQADMASKTAIFGAFAKRYNKVEAFSTWAAQNGLV